MTIYVLNTPILTDWGMYSFVSWRLEDVRKLLHEKTFVSAVGHEGTANLMTRLIGIPIPVNRTAIKMAKWDVAIVFRLLTRLPEGKVLSEEELAQLPYEFGFLDKIE
jgi:hypothetical protein